jgi:hypothetical protein
VSCQKPEETEKRTKRKKSRHGAGTLLLKRGSGGGKVTAQPTGSFAAAPSEKEKIKKEKPPLKKAKKNFQAKKKRKEMANAKNQRN